MSSLAEQKVRKQLGEKIKEYRNQSKLSQEELAIKIHSTKEYISHIENGLKTPSVSFLIKVAYGLGIEIWELFKS